MTTNNQPTGTPTYSTYMLKHQANVERAQQIKEQYPDNLVNMNRTKLWMHDVQQVGRRKHSRLHWSDIVYLVLLAAIVVGILAKAKGLL